MLAYVSPILSPSLLHKIESTKLGLTVCGLECYSY